MGLFNRLKNKLTGQSKELTISNTANYLTACFQMFERHPNLLETPGLLMNPGDENLRDELLEKLATHVEIDALPTLKLDNMHTLVNLMKKSVQQYLPENFSHKILQFDKAKLTELLSKSQDPLYLFQEALSSEKQSLFNVYMYIAIKVAENAKQNKTSTEVVAKLCAEDLMGNDTGVFEPLTELLIETIEYYLENPKSCPYLIRNRKALTVSGTLPLPKKISH